MDSKKDNNSLMTNKENYLINSVFVKDTELQFIFKKTEKIVTAIYLITNFFTIEEPLKWSLRKSANSLLQNILSFNQSSLSDKEKKTYELNSCLLEMSSLFDLAYYSGFISTMNYQILSAEIGNLSLNVGNYNSKILTSNKNLFSTDYFHVQNFSDLDSKTDFEQTNFKKTDFKQTSTKGQQSPIKDTNTRAGMTYRGNVSDFKNYIKDMSNKGQQNQKDSQAIKDTNSQNNVNKIKDKKTNLERRNQIIAEIKKTGEVSVKDIAKVVPGVSEKTLQRELIAMVADGVLDKKGERRWSKYSIKN